MYFSDFSGGPSAVNYFLKECVAEITTFYKEKFKSLCVGSDFLSPLPLYTNRFSNHMHHGISKEVVKLGNNKNSSDKTAYNQQKEEKGFSRYQ